LLAALQVETVTTTPLLRDYRSPKVIVESQIQQSAIHIQQDGIQLRPINVLDLQSSQQRLAPIFSKEQGKLNWYCLDFWGQTLELDIPSIKSAYTDGIRWRPLAETFLSRLQASHLDVVLITNAHPITLEIKAAKLPLEKWFDKIVSSHTYGAPKETPDFWRELIADRPFEPHRTLFIDDGEHVLDSACSFGVAHLITLRQPDSSLPPRELTRHPSILHFDEIMQGLPPFD